MNAMTLSLFLMVGSGLAYGQGFAFSNGTFTGSTTLISGSSAARSFNGSTDSLRSTTPYLSQATSFTIAFWFKSGNLAQNSTYIFESGGANPPTAQISVLYGYVNSGGKDQIELYTAGHSGGNLRTGSQITIADANWHHVAYRYNGTVWCYFLDGVKTTINPNISATLANFSGGAASWMDRINAPANTSGSMARFYVSTEALTDAQIQTLADPCNLSTAGVPGTVGYWLIKGASPEPESSPSPNNNSLTVTGTTAVTGPTCH